MRCRVLLRIEQVREGAAGRLDEQDARLRRNRMSPLDVETDLKVPTAVGLREVASSGLIDLGEVETRRWHRSATALQG